jgi:ABC-type Zn uptake system ZnuABC Zn-binding protein ZnuA/ABC-type Mn2+/Zn2+ transport system permease subunit
VPAPFDLPFMQRAALEVLVLAVVAGTLGTWIVLRGLAFYTHAVGTATFPGLVLADGLHVAAAPAALGTAVVVAVAVGLLTRRAPHARDGVTALVLVGALALGVILASDVFGSQASVERLLFGSLLAIDPADVRLAAGVALLVLMAGAVLGPRWLATGFDEAAARAQGLRSPVADGVLLLLVALAAVAVLSAVGALLVTALLVVPAATTRLLCTRVRPWQAATVALAAAEGLAGLWLSWETNAPPGATIAVLNAAVFAAVAAWRTLAGRRHARRAGAAAAVAALALAAGGCGDGADGAGGGRVQVVATTAHLADVARQAGGGAVEVRRLLPLGADPHDYEPRPDDVRAVAEADVVLASGLGFDDWIGEVARNAGDTPVVDVGAAVPHRRPADGDGGGGGDPHWWHDPRNVAAATATIARAVAGAAPGRRATVGRSARAYAARVRALDAAQARCFAAVPARDRKLVTDHDAFGHLAGRYGIEVVGAVIPSLTSSAQPSAGDVAELSDTVRREGVRTIFPERSLSPRLAEAIARQTGAEVGPALYADTLGPPGSPQGTTLGAAAFNADALVRGFTGGARGCDAARA